MRQLCALVPAWGSDVGALRSLLSAIRALAKAREADRRGLVAAEAVYHLCNVAWRHSGDLRLLVRSVFWRGGWKGLCPCGHDWLVE
jgi:hypothetical protein